jgi:hypothetical protein
VWQRPVLHPSLSVALALFACLACASSSTPGPNTTIVTRQLTSPGNRPVETTDVTGPDVVQVKGSPLEALTALTQIYSTLQIPIGTMVQDAGQIGNQSFRPATHRLHGHLLSFYVNCGQESMVGSRADLDDVTFSIVSTARMGADSVTEVGTMVTAYARPSGTSSNAVDCESTGELEKAIADQLKSALGAPTPAARS